MQKSLKSNTGTEWTHETLSVCLLNTSSFPSNLVQHLLSGQIILLDRVEEAQSVWSTVYSFKFPTNHVSALKTCGTAGMSRIKVIHFGFQMNNLRTACWKPLALSYSQIWWWLVMCMSKRGQPFEAAQYQPSFSMSQITAQMLVEPHYHNANMLSRFKCGVCCWSKPTLKPLKNSIKECSAAHGCQNSTGSEFWGILSHLLCPNSLHCKFWFVWYQSLNESRCLGLFGNFQ